MDTKINTRDAVFYIDIYCYSCKRLVAYSNTIEVDGCRYCQRCRPIGKPKEEDMESIEKQSIHDRLKGV